MSDKILIASEFRCHIYKGDFFLSSKAYTIYKRYADMFGEIVLCSRFVQLTKLEKGLKKADFIQETIPIESLIKSLLGFYNKEILKKLEECSLVIGRLPSITAYRVIDIAKKTGKPYLAELMCDGWDPYWNHGIEGKLIAGYMHNKMKRVTYTADYAVYVTEKYLQKRYPCKNKSIHASNVVIQQVEQTVLQKRLKKISDMPDLMHISIMTTASVDLLSKGQRYVVQAMGKLKEKGIIVFYYLAGDGEQRHLKECAKKADVEEQLIFLGELTLKEVYAYLDKIDIYIQPSLQEGLPRAVIEAMSRACPCLGARTAGIPELLDEECIFDRASSEAIVNSVLHMLSTGLEKYARHNFEHSREYLEEILDERRNQYFKEIKEKLR